MTETTSDSPAIFDAVASFMKSQGYPSLRGPPGLSLEPEDNEPMARAEKPAPTKLSLADLCREEPIRAPPGFDEGEIMTLSYDGEKVLFENTGCKVSPLLSALEAPPGLPPPPTKKGFKKGIESEDTSVGGDSDHEPNQPISLEMMLTDVSHLKSDAPLFVPKLSSELATMLPDISSTQRTPLRTGLRSKAELYVPSSSALPFVPMSAVEDAWENWHLQNSPYGCNAEYADAEYADDWEGNYPAEYYPEQEEWAY